jgi:recombination protein RecA
MAKKPVVTQGARRSKIEIVADRINKEYEAEVVMVGSKIKFKRLPRTPSGCVALDIEIGGGWGRGRLHHLFGKRSSGKSFLAYNAIAQAQLYCQWCTTLIKQGGCNCNANDPIASAFVDVEHTDTPAWRKKLDIDPDLFLYVPVEYGEQGIDYVSSLVRQPEIGIIVIDSIAALAPAEVIEKSAGDNQSPAALARIVTRGTRAWQAGLNAKYKHPKLKEPDPDDPSKQRAAVWPNLCTIFALNQLRDQIGGYGGQPEPPGGHALRHMASIEARLGYNASDFILEGDKEKHESHAVSQWIHFEIEKNKTYPPRRRGSFQVNFSDAQIDNDGSYYDYAKRWEIVKQNGAWFEYGKVKVKGEDNFFAALYEQDLFGALRLEVMKKAHEEMDDIVVTPAEAKSVKGKVLEAATT